MNKYILLLLSVSISIMSCSLNKSTKFKKIDILEIVLNDIFIDQTVNAAHYKLKNYYVSIDGEDPDSDLLKRFDNIYDQKILPRSMCYNAEGDTTLCKGWRCITIYDKKTKEAGIVIDINYAKHTYENNIITVGASTYFGSLYGGHDVYILKHINGKWRIYKIDHIYSI